MRMKEDIRTAINPRAISKAEDKQGRDQLARKIQDIRSKKQKKQSSLKILDSIETLESDIGRIKEDIDATRKTTGEAIRAVDNNKKTATQKERLTQKEALLQALIHELKELNKDQEELILLIRASFPDLTERKLIEICYPDEGEERQLLKEYYETVSSLPMSIEEKKEKLKEESVKNLTMEEYINLWKRLNPHYLSHVTRQGVRDHFGMQNHDSGMCEYHNGLVDVLGADKMLRSSYDRSGLLNPGKTKELKNLLAENVLKQKNEEDAKGLFRTMINTSPRTFTPSYPDFTAVHFAVGDASGSFYGAEKNNEAFYVFPADIMANMHYFYFNNGAGSFKKPKSGKEWNDAFLWPKTGMDHGVSVDLGIVFLPKNAPVDPKTGSKYALEKQTVNGKESLVPVSDVNQRQHFEAMAMQLLNDEKTINKWADSMKGNRNFGIDSFQRDFEHEIREMFNNNHISCEEGVDVEGEVLSGFMEAVLTYLNSRNEAEYRNNISSIVERNFHDVYKRAEKPVKSQEYWEKYFRKNPEKAPRRVFYYDGNPADAVEQFFKDNGIGRADTSNKDGKVLGFDENLVNDLSTDQRVYRGRERLFDAGDRIIEDHYRHNSATPVPQTAP